MNTLFNNLKKTGITLACTVFMMMNARAQVIVPASYTDQPIAIGADVQTINCDMMECPLQGGVRLSAIVWDGTAPQSGSLYVDYTGNPSPVLLSLPPTPSGTAYLPDVVIGNMRRGDKNGTHVIGVIYLDPNNYVTYYSWYHVNGVGGTLTVTYAGTRILSGAYGPDAKYPHIDGFADHKNLTGGLPSIYEFAAGWEEHTPTNIVTVGATGPLDNPGIIPTYLISSGSPHNEAPDVACITDVSTGARTALFAYSHQGRIEYSEFDVASSTVTSSTTYNMSCHNVRIEAMNLYNPFNPSLTKYQIAAVAMGSTDVVGFNNNFYPTVWGGPLSNADPVLFPTATSYTSPAVAAGTGTFGSPGNIGNQVYSTGMAVNGTSSYYGRQIDVNTGTFPGFAGGNDYYEINQTAIPVSSLYRPLALSSSSNSGYDLLSVWFDGNVIIRKFSNNAFVFKGAPTGVNNVTQASMFTLSPNPAQDIITIKGIDGAKYAIKDVTGRLVGQGTLSGQGTTVDVKSLAKGLYLVNVYDQGNLHTCKFVKE